MIRLRLWYWLSKHVTDGECKRWLEDAPIDRSLFNPVQAHYTAAPIFDDPTDDPVPQRSGWFWHHENTVSVPELPEEIIEPAAPSSHQMGASQGRRRQSL